MVTLYATGLTIQHDRRYTYKRNFEARTPNYCYQGKEKNTHIFWVCIYSLIYLACSAHAPYDIVM
jgi:hypothetical protein